MSPREYTVPNLRWKDRVEKDLRVKGWRREDRQSNADSSRLEKGKVKEQCKLSMHFDMLPD